MDRPPDPSSTEPVDADPGDVGTMERGYARGRVRDEQARAALKPLAPGERPRAVTAAALLATVLCLAEIVSFAFDYSAGDNSRVARSVVVVVLLGAVAIGMWRARYWAVIVMQALLALTIVTTALAGVTVGNATALALVAGILLVTGPLFWYLVKALARLQMPPGR